MKPLALLTRACFTLCLFTLSTEALCEVAASYSLTDLGSLPSASSHSQASGINNLGQVVGASIAADGRFHAFMWDADTGMADLGLLPGRVSSMARAINDLGQVVGVATEGPSSDHGFLWTSAQGMMDLGDLSDGSGHSSANDINNAGQVVGGSMGRAYLWEAGSGMMDLGVLTEFSASSEATAINDASQVAGNSFTANPNAASRAFIWEDGAGLQDLGVTSATVNNTEATAINNSAVVVGTLNDPGKSGTTGAGFVYSSGQGMTDIGTLQPSNVPPNHLAINDSDVMVGYGGSLFGPSAIAIRDSEGPWIDLTSRIDSSGLGWSFLEVTDINNAGQIVGSGIFNGDVHAFILNPVPEPTTLGVMGIGLLLALPRRRVSNSTGLLSPK